MLHWLERGGATRRDRHLKRDRRYRSWGSRVATGRSVGVRRGVVGGGTDVRDQEKRLWRDVVWGVGVVPRCRSLAAWLQCLLDMAMPCPCWGDSEMVDIM